MKKTIITYIVASIMLIPEIMYAVNFNDMPGNHIENNMTNVIAQPTSKGKTYFVETDVLDAGENDNDNNYYLGRQYYDSLIQDAVKKNNVFSFAWYYNISTKAFDNNGDETGLASSIFGGPFQIKDVFLIAKLANQGLLSTQRVIPTGANPQFTNDPNTQYLNLLSTMSVFIDADQREFGCDVTYMHRFDINCARTIACTLGFTLPVKYSSHFLNIFFIGGKLEQAGYVQQATQRETSVRQFFRDFESTQEDFFVRAVLQPKGIDLIPSQNKFGIGDLTLFALFDFSGCNERFDGLQLGINLITPTAKRGSANILWPIEMGTGGGFALDIFGNVLINGGHPLVNPVVHGGIEFGCGSFTVQRRIPQIKSQATVEFIRNNPELIVPIFREYYSQPFSELDSTIPFLADSAFNVKTKRGYKLFIGGGNYFYQVFRTYFRLGIFYDYLQSGKDKIETPASTTGIPITSLVTAQTGSKAHRFGWNLAYVFKNLMELNIGSQHIFAGKNVEKQNQFFATFVAVF